MTVVRKQADLKRLARLLKALGHRDRLRIVAALAHQEACVCELTASLGLRQATVSQHLSMLRRAGAVRGQRRGANVFYRIASPLVPPLLEILGIRAVEMLGASAVEAGDEACPNCQHIRSVIRHPGVGHT